MRSEVVEYEIQDEAVQFLIGLADLIRSEVTLTDPGTGAVVSTYNFGVITGGGGLLVGGLGAALVYGLEGSDPAPAALAIRYADQLRESITKEE